MSVVITLCVITDNCNFVSALEETILHTRSCKNGFDLNIWKLKMLGFFSSFPISARASVSLEGSQALPVCPDESSSCKMSVDTLWSDTDGEKRSARRKPRPKASFFHHRSHRNWPGIEPWAPRWLSATTLWRLHTVVSFSARHSATLCEVYISTAAQLSVPFWVTTFRRDQLPSSVRVIRVTEEQNPKHSFVWKSPGFARLSFWRSR